MPMDRSRYPENWEEISLAIRERAGWCCEWCGVKNGEVGGRDRNGTWYPEEDLAWIDIDDALDLFGPHPKMLTIVLTVAHLGTPHPDGTPGNKYDKHDCRTENLAALCQRCHLNYDREDHVRNAAATRRRRKVEAGQIEMALETAD